jgi:fibroblast growth factor receptor 2
MNPVLVSTNKTAKVSDFGMCQLLKRKLYTTRTGRLPVKWMAPESLEMAKFNHQTDV